MMDGVSYPKMRWFEALPVMHGGREAFYLRDPEGIAANGFVVSREVVFIVSMMNGKRSLRDIQEEFFRASGVLVQTEQLELIVGTMDENVFLHNERYLSEKGRLQKEYLDEPCRRSFLAGKSYPGARNELEGLMARMLGDTEAPVVGRRITGLIAPHIDYDRGWKVYRDIYSYLPQAEPSLVVIFGTCHHYMRNLISISLKDFATPLGIVKNCADMGQRMKTSRVLRGLIEEWPHRNEHSIELQLPIIQFLARQKNVEIVPVLTGSFHEYIEGSKDLRRDGLGEIVEELRTALQSSRRPYLIVAAADLAHIGAQFGDEEPLDTATLERSRGRDRIILHRVEKSDGPGFFAAVKAEGDKRRICGLSPIYFLLSLIGPSVGKVVSYDQWTDGRSSVSFAGALFHDGLP